MQQGVTTLPATIHRGSNKYISDVTILEKGSNLLEKIRVRYETETGEVKYKTFYAGPSVEDVTSSSGGHTGPPSASAQEAGESISCVITKEH